jgi:hypothetical protein
VVRFPLPHLPVERRAQLTDGNLDRIRRKTTGDADADGDGSGQLLLSNQLSVEGARIITPIEEAGAHLPAPDFPNYAAGSEGPTSWHDLLKIRGNIDQADFPGAMRERPNGHRPLSE